MRRATGRVGFQGRGLGRDDETAGCPAVSGMIWGRYRPKVAYYQRYQESMTGLELEVAAAAIRT
jgi:hypothetical protein